MPFDSNGNQYIDGSPSGKPPDALGPLTQTPNGWGWNTPHGFVPANPANVNAGIPPVPLPIPIPDLPIPGIPPVSNPGFPFQNLPQLPGKPSAPLPQLPGSPIPKGALPPSQSAPLPELNIPPKPPIPKLNIPPKPPIPKPPTPGKPPPGIPGSPSNPDVFPPGKPLPNNPAPRPIDPSGPPQPIPKPQPKPKPHWEYTPPWAEPKPKPTIEPMLDPNANPIAPRPIPRSDPRLVRPTADAPANPIAPSRPRPRPNSGRPIPQPMPQSPAPAPINSPVNPAFPGIPENSSPQPHPGFPNFVGAIPGQQYEIRFKVVDYRWGYTTDNGGITTESKEYFYTIFDPLIKSIAVDGSDLEWQFEIRDDSYSLILSHFPLTTVQYKGESGISYLKNHEERPFYLGWGHTEVVTKYDNYEFKKTEISNGWQAMEIVGIFPSLSPQPMPQPIPQPTPTQLEEDMACCAQNVDQMRMMMRELNQTITVDAVDVVTLPTGDKAAIAKVEVVQVFGMPGTTSGWKRFFNHLADTKKKAVDAVNQARKSRLMARLVKTMQVANFLLDIHTAAMISRDLGESFFNVVFSTIDNAVKVIDDLPFVGNLFDIDDNFSSQSALGSALDEMAQKALGVENWTEIKTKWAALNRITASANTLLMSVRDIQDSSSALGALSCEITSKFANKARKDGVISDDGPFFPENYSKQSAFRKKIYDLEEGAQGVLNAANFFEELTGNLVQTQENYKQFKEGREAFDKALKEDGPKVFQDNKPVKDKVTEDKLNSQGATVEEDHTKPQGETNP